MKKIFSVTRLRVMLISTLAIVSCESLLDEKNYTKVTVEKNYSTYEDVLANMYGIYTILSTPQLYGGGASNYLNISDLPSDCIRSHSGVNEWTGYKFTSSSGSIKNWWSGNYKIISAANDFIKNVYRCPESELSGTELNKLVGEAKFFRALGYFNLVRAYGRVPLILNAASDVSEVTYPYRAELSEIYNLIISDLNEAMRVLDIYSGQRQTGRVLRGSAAGLLAKVYLTKGYSEAKSDDDFYKAVKISDDIISGNYGPYSLQDDYSQVFSPDNEGNSELMAYVSFDLLPNVPSSIIKTFSPSSYYPIVTSGVIYAPLTLVNSYDKTNDTRFKYGFMAKHPDTGAWLTSDHRTFFCKYKDDNKTPSGEDRCDFPLLRLSEIFLIHSEAMHSGSLALSPSGKDKYYGINKVRERARESTVVGECKIANLDDTNVTGDFLDIILQERLWELNCEGHRRWDLIRIGRLKETMTAFWQTQGVPEMDNCEIRPEHILFPMPQQEVDVNPNLVPAGETNNGYIISGDGDVEI